MQAKKPDVFLGFQREKSISWGVFSIFRLEGPYVQFHITKPTETRRTCWHSRSAKSYQFTSKNKKRKKVMV